MLEGEREVAVVVRAVAHSPAKLLVDSPSGADD